MRQTLLRIRLDAFWSTSAIEKTTAVGLGYLVLAIWAVFGLKWLVTRVRQDGFSFTRDDLPKVLIWAGSAAGVLLAVAWLVSPNVKSFPIYGYGFMLFLGFFAAAWLAARRARSVGVPGELIWDLAMWIMVAGIGGARLFYVVQKSDRFFADKTGMEKFFAVFNLPDGGLVLYGGVILALIAFVLFCRWKKVNPLLMADVIMPSFFVGLMFGRIGCFLNGCCYGDVSHLPWAVRFPPGSATFQALVGRGFLDPDALATMPLHPTQIYSAVNALLLAWLTAAYFRRRQRDGSVLALSLCVYPVTRFVIEYLRSDELTVVVTIRSLLFWGREVATVNTPFTISQCVSLLLFAFGLLFVLWLNRRGAVAHVSKQADSHAPAAA